MKVGLIRCLQTEELCPATRCLASMRKKRDAFAALEGEVVPVGIVSCGGCPGKKAGLRASMLVKRGAEAVVLASCITRGTPIGYACPFAGKLRAVVRAAIGDSVTLLDYSHEAKPAAPAGAGAQPDPEAQPDAEAQPADAGHCGGAHAPTAGGA